jgi:ClpP class serine protease
MVPAQFELSAFSGYSITEGVARIPIVGVLTPTPDKWAAYFYGSNTAYSDLIPAIDAAQGDPRVTDVEYFIDSPGGTVAGLFETVDAMARVTKPSRAIVGGQAASAAYSLAAQADSIVATGRGSAFGSIGVVQRMAVNGDVVSITSRAAPNKAPDPATEEGRAVIQDQLDQYHALYAQSIADGRGVSVDKVNTEYGQGSVFLADSALKRGMIDAIATPQPAASGAKKGKKAMTLAELMAAYPDAYAAAVQVGVSQERDRTSAHLTMGEAAGAMETAVAAILAGDQLTPARVAEYHAAGMKRALLAARATESAAVPSTTTTPAAPAAAEEGAVPAAVFAAAANALGLEVAADA